MAIFEQFFDSCSLTAEEHAASVWLFWFGFLLATGPLTPCQRDTAHVTHSRLLVFQRLMKKLKSKLVGCKILWSKMKMFSH